eukprot:831949-Amphidinium_carterae.1
MTPQTSWCFPDRGTPYYNFWGCRAEEVDIRGAAGQLAATTVPLPPPKTDNYLKTELKEIMCYAIILRLKLQARVCNSARFLNLKKQDPFCVCSELFL